jgi:hypothetical protein
MVVVGEVGIGEGDVDDGRSEDCEGEVEHPSRRLWRKWGAERMLPSGVAALGSVRSG